MSPSEPWARSASQRCMADLLTGCFDLARAHGLPVHCHVLETVAQAVTGQELYGGSLVRSIDGVSSNDTASIFDVMRVTGLLHGASGPDADTWLSAAELLRVATIGGARSALIEDVCGSLEPGKATDMILLDLDDCAFTPFNDVARHLFYAAKGTNVRTVIVAGEVVMDDRRMTRFEKDAPFPEIRARAPAWLADHGEIEKRSRVLQSYFVEISRGSAARHAGSTAMRVMRCFSGAIGSRNMTCDRKRPCSR